MNRVVHFEIHAGNPERAIAFYGGLFGWQFKKYGDGQFDYWLVTTGKDEPGIDGGLMRRMGSTPPVDAPTPVIAYVCTVGVADIDAMLAAAQKAGATPAHPKGAIPGVGWTAYMKDPEGNIFGLFQGDTEAK
jgi:predicted enzyme related to lactoylglutathione lyase